MSHKLEFQLLKEQKIIDEPWLKVTNNDYQLPDGSELKNFYVVEEKNGVTVVALTTEKEILIVEQFRPPVGVVTYDLPGGLIEGEKDDPLERAKHELKEETGYTSNNWIDLGHFYPAPHRMHNVQRAYLALDIQHVANPELDHTEFVEYKKISLKELDKMIQNNEFLCGYCITAYLKAKLHLGL